MGTKSLHVIDEFQSKGTTIWLMKSNMHYKISPQCIYNLEKHISILLYNYAIQYKSMEKWYDWQWDHMKWMKVILLVVVSYTFMTFIVETYLCWMKSVIGYLTTVKLVSAMYNDVIHFRWSIIFKVVPYLLQIFLI